MKEFAGKVAGITGAANGIGEAFALEAARRGMNLALIDIEGDRLQEFKKECEALGAPSMAASGGMRQRLSSTTRQGWRGAANARTSRRGLSSSTVPMP